MAGRKIRPKAQMIAAHLLEVHEDDLEWDVDRFQVKGLPEKRKTMKEICLGRLQQRAARAWSRGWRRSTITIRPT